MMKFQNRRFATVLAAPLLALVFALGSAPFAPQSAAGGFVTIFPNYSDGNCGGKGGSVQHVKVAAFPGRTTVNANNQRWARIDVASSGNVKIVANLYCVYGFIKSPGGWVTVERTIRNAVAWKSYYF